MLLEKEPKDKTITFLLEDSLKKDLENYSHTSMINKSAIIRDALKKYLRGVSRE